MVQRWDIMKYVNQHLEWRKTQSFLHFCHLKQLRVIMQIHLKLVLNAILNVPIFTRRCHCQSTSLMNEPQLKHFFFLWIIGEKKWFLEWKKSIFIMNECTLKILKKERSTVAATSKSIMRIYMKIMKPKEKTRIPGSINFILIVYSQRPMD